MIYTCYFEYLHQYLIGIYGTRPVAMTPYSDNPNNWEPKPRKKAIVGKLKESPNDSFCFIITVEQWPRWEEFVKEFELGDYVSYQMPYYVTNINHNNGRRLKFVLLQHPNHPQRRAGQSPTYQTMPASERTVS